MPQTHNPRIGIIIQARIGSERLPGKVLKKLPDGNEILDWVVKRCKLSKLAKNVVVATSQQPADDQIVDFCVKKDYLSFRGDEHNVLQRYVECLKKFKFDAVVRITADCPLVDPGIIDASIRKYLESACDYVHNSRSGKTFPRGLDVEVANSTALEQALNLSTRDYEREHVTIYFYENPKKFKIETIQASPNYFAPEMRLTVDTSEDLELICKIQKHFNLSANQLSAPDVIQYLKNNPSLLKINAHIQQKSIEGRII